MATAMNRTGLGWGARLLIGVALLLVGAVGAAWALARYDQAARFLGVAPAPVARTAPRPLVIQPQAPVPRTEPDAARIAELEQRLARVETAAQKVQGSAGRADAMLVAFAARRAVDRGVALGYLEPLLLDRFARTNARAVGVIITGSHHPVSLNDLIAEYRQLGTVLRSSADREGWWTQFKRELGSVIQVRHADRPSTQPDARYSRALALLEDGEVDAALAETMRLPGAQGAQEWVRKARQYVVVHRALDEIESAALLGRNDQSSR